MQSSVGKYMVMIGVLPIGSTRGRSLCEISGFSNITQMRVTSYVDVMYFMFSTDLHSA